MYERSPPPLRKTVGFPKTCDNENNKRVWQAAGAAVSIAFLQNWPHGQIRCCYAKSVGERQVNSCSNPGKPLGFPKTCLGQGR